MDFLPSKKILKNMSFLVIGEIFAKIIMFFITIYLARSLNPEFYGRYSLAYNIALGTLFIVDLGMNTLVLREGSKDHKHLGNTVSNVMSFKIIWGFVVALTLCIITWLFLPYDNNQKMLIYVACILVIIQGVSTLLNIVFRAFEEMKYNSIVRISDVVIFGAVVYLLFTYDKNPLYILIAWIISRIIITIMQLIFIKKFIKIKFLLIPNWSLCFGIIKHSFWIGVAVLVTNTYGYINVLIVSLYLSAASIGFYAVASQLVTAGTMIRGVISDAIFPNTCKNIHKPDYAKKFLRYISILSLLAALGALIVTILAKWIILIAFGKEYLPAVLVLQILIWYVPIYIYNIWGLQVLDSTNNQKYHVWTESIIIIITLALNLLLIRTYGIVGVAIATITGRFIGSIFLNYTANKIAKKEVVQ